MGGEPIDRSETGGETLLLVDLTNRIPASGTLLGGKVFIKGKTEVSFVVLRLLEEDLTVLWISNPASIPGNGLFRLTFNVPVAVEKGDLIGLSSPGILQVPIDHGTGDTRTRPGLVKVGKVISVDDMEAGDRCTYSFGVVGFLVSPPAGALSYLC